jgi:hypothetical protein
VQKKNSKKSLVSSDSSRFRKVVVGFCFSNVGIALCLVVIKERELVGLINKCKIYKITKIGVHRVMREADPEVLSASPKRTFTGPKKACKD